MLLLKVADSAPCKRARTETDHGTVRTRLLERLRPREGGTADCTSVACGQHVLTALDALRSRETRWPSFATVQRVNCLFLCLIVGIVPVFTLRKRKKRDLGEEACQAHNPLEHVPVHQ